MWPLGGCPALPGGRTDRVRYRNQSRAIPVPAGRLFRLTRLGAHDGRGCGQHGGATVRRSWGRASGPALRDLLLTPANVRRVTDQLAQMRGAAMKVGQLVSMDAGDMLPPELAEIMARLRADAHFMPPAQLQEVLTEQLGRRLAQARSTRFDVRPIAAASIGQVHRAQTRDGRDLAIKVQYPGVRAQHRQRCGQCRRADPDVGPAAQGFDLAPYLDEAAQAAARGGRLRARGRAS